MAKSVYEAATSLRRCFRVFLVVLFTADHDDDDHETSRKLDASHHIAMVVFYVFVVVVV